MSTRTIDKNPRMVVWELTLRCNLKCLHCGSSAGTPRQNELSTKEAIQLCHDLSELDFKGISLMGGEIFLRKDWQLISKEVKDIGLVLSVISNGYVDAKKIVPHLASLETDCVMIGLDGASAKSHDYIRGVKGSFEKAKAFIKEAKKADIAIGIITTVHKLNFHELPHIKDYVLAEEINWHIQEASPIGRFPKNLVLSNNDYYSLGLFISSMQKKISSNKIAIAGSHNFGFHSNIILDLNAHRRWNGCYAGITVLGIQSNGNIKGCLALPDVFIEGNIRNRNVKKIWNDPNAFEYNRKFKEKELGDKCVGCKYNKTCKGGCTTRSISMNDSLHNDPHCYHRFEESEGL